MMIAAEDLYNRELHVAIWKLKYDPGYPAGVIDLVLKVLATDLVAISVPPLALNFKENELALLLSFNLSAHTKNKELLARWYDISILLDQKNIAIHLMQVVINYRSVYEATGRLDYLVRSWAMVKFGKQLFKNDLKAFFADGINIVLTLKPVFWQNALIRQLPHLASYTDCREKLETHLEMQITGFLAADDYDSSRVLIKSLGDIQAMNGDQLHLRLAENFEKQADVMLAEKPANTFIPQISERFQEALRELVKVNGSAVIRKRIASKLQTAQRQDYKMVTSGLPIGPAIDFQVLQKNLLKINVTDFGNAYQLLLNLPITPDELIAAKAAKEKEGLTFIAKLFEGTVKLNNVGAPVGFADGDKARLISARRLFRETTIAYVHLIKDLMDIYGQVGKPLIYDELIKSKSVFIPEDRLHIYFQGLFHGFNNDFISAANVLMPQIENSLRHVATLNGIVMTNFDKKEQFENTLGGCLQKMEGMTDPDLMAELQGFLVAGSDVNFRNELAHGNMYSVHLYHYGRYLWWLTLKLVFQTQKYFKMEADTEKDQ